MVSKVIARRDEHPRVAGGELLVQRGRVNDQVESRHKRGCHQRRRLVAGRSPRPDVKWGHVGDGELDGRHRTRGARQHDGVEFVVESVHPVEPTRVHEVMDDVEQRTLDEQEQDDAARLLRKCQTPSGAAVTHGQIVSDRTEDHVVDDRSAHTGSVQLLPSVALAEPPDIAVRDAELEDQHEHHPEKGEK